MSFKTVIAGLASIAIVAGSAFMPSAASAARGGGGIHAGGGGYHPGGGFHYEGGGRFHPGGFRGGFGGWIGGYPWVYGPYPLPYYYEPSCGYVHVKYYRHHRAYWHWVYRCE
jgi:hypothetical protein